MEQIELTEVFAVDAATLFDAWLDGDTHAKMTGAPATGRAEVGASFTSFDGYASGEVLELERPGRIVQSWKATDFPFGAGASKVTVTFTEQHDGKTVLSIVHSDLPDGTSKGYEDGWKKFYFTPMHRFFTHKAISEVYATATAAKKPKAKAKAKAQPKVKAKAKAKPKAKVKVKAKVKAKVKPKTKARRPAAKKKKAPRKKR